MAEFDNRRHVLLTGATGFLGSHLALAFLRRNDIRLFCLARGKGGRPAPRRLLDALEKAWEDQGETESFRAFLAARKDNLVTWETDLDDLRSVAREDLPVARMDEVWHLAAKVDFLEHRQEETRRSNVDGTLALLGLAGDWGVDSFNYFSTAYVAGTRSGVIREDDDPSACEANNPYEASKREAEKAVLAWGRAKGGLTRILRPSIIVGHSRTLKADSPYGLYGFLTLMLRLRDDMRDRMPEYFLHNPVRLLLEPRASLNLVCVDQVVEAAMRLRAKCREAPGVFHLCNPDFSPLEDLFLPASEELNVRLKAETSEEGLNPIDFLLNQHTRIFNCYFRNPKAFNMERTLRATGMERSDFSISPAMQAGLIREFTARYSVHKAAKSSAVKAAVNTLERRAMPREGGQVLPYYIGGAGTRALVIINAYGQSISFWDWVIARFLGERRIVIWQARGTTSASGGLNGFHPLSVHVGDLAAILERERIEECDIVGWCTGPKLALEFYRLHASKVRSMTFLTGAFKGHPGMEGLDTRYEANMEPLCCMVADDPACAGLLIDTLKSVLVGRTAPAAAPNPTPGDSRTRILDILSLVNRNLKPLVIEPFLTDTSVVSYARQLLDFWRHDVSGILGMVRVPVLFISGELDNIASPQISRAVARLVPGSTLLEIRGGSHYPHFENHELLNEILECFLRNPSGFEFVHDMVRSEKNNLTDSALLEPLPA